MNVFFFILILNMLVVHESRILCVKEGKKHIRIPRNRKVVAYGSTQFFQLNYNRSAGSSQPTTNSSKYQTPRIALTISAVNLIATDHLFYPYPARYPRKRQTTPRPSPGDGQSSRIAPFYCSISAATSISPSTLYATHKTRPPPKEASLISPSSPKEAA